MKRFVLIACTAALAACNKGPDIDVKNASVGEVAEKARAAAADSRLVEPGRWETKVTLLEADMPDLPPQYAARIKETMAKVQGRTVATCITAADLKKAKPDFLAAHTKNCRFDHYTMGSGKIDAQMTCTAPQGGSMSVATIGTYSPDAYEATSVMTMSGGPTGARTTKSHTESHRIGECKGDEINFKKQEVGQ